MKNNIIIDASTERGRKISALVDQVTTEIRWIEFMKEVGYPQESQKMVDATLRLSRRVGNLDRALSTEHVTNDLL